MTARKLRLCLCLAVLIGSGPAFAAGPAGPKAVGGDQAVETAGGPAGRWLAEDIRQGGVIDRLQTILVLAADGGVSGTGGCNTMAGRATISGDRIAFGPLASTHMACTPAAMDQEAKFFATLAEVGAWRLDLLRGKLILLDANGVPLMTLARL